MAIPNQSEKSVALDREENSKYCRGCGKLSPLSNYYKHDTGKDGHQNICKPCKREKFRDHYKNNVDRITARIKEYQKTSEGRKAHYKAYKNERERNFEKYSARRKLHYAIKTNQIDKPNNCQECLAKFTSREIHAHHIDYSEPLIVKWLCVLCHKAEHGFLIRNRSEYVYS